MPKVCRFPQKLGRLFNLPHCLLLAMSLLTLTSNFTEMRTLLEDSKVRAVQSFVRSNYRVLHNHPQLLLQQSANAGSFLRDAARSLLRDPPAGSLSSCTSVVLERCRPSQPDPMSLHFMDNGPCSALAARDGGPFALGFESGAILLLQEGSAEVRRNGGRKL